MTSIKPPAWFWIIAVLITFWNAAGVFNYINQVTMSEEALAALDERMRMYLTNRPAWATGSFAIAVWAGLFGSIGLIIKRSWAIPLFVISLIGVVLSLVADFTANEISLSGAEIGFNLIIVAVAILTVFFARVSKRKDYIY